jgi:hypothetical protein
MLPSYLLLREQLAQVITNKEEQGHRVEGLATELEGLPDSYDALWAFGKRLCDLPLLADWQFVEPSDLEGIWAECDPQRPTGALCEVDLADAAQRVEAAFLGSVAGCVLGKPLEVRPSLADLEEWVTLLNPRDEFCGALIRADAYGYACPGRPALAAELAWRDASWTHRRTGIYGTMFVAAAIATALVARQAGLGPLEVFETALRFVPRRSRFHAIAADSLEQVRAAGDWRDGYARIHGKYGQYTHCQVYQECGTLINTLRFARDVGDGICMQVMQGNDTDSFGATAGSILGAYFGPGHLESRWLAPFGDDIHTALAWFYERSLSGLAKRMGQLPARIAGELVAG